MLDDFAENGAMPPELVPVHQQLVRDSAAWQTTVPATAHLGQFIDQLESDAALPTRRQSNRGDIMQPPVRAPAAPPTSTRRYTRAFIPATVALLVVILGAVVFHTLSTSRSHTSPGVGAQPTATATQPAVIAPQPANLNLPLPANGYLGAMAMATATDGWAVSNTSVPETGGANTALPDSYFLHYHDGVWTRSADVFTDVDIVSLAMATPSEGWAVGNGGLHNNIAGDPVLLHYTQGHWQQATFPTPSGTGAVYPTTIAMPSSTFGWIKGQQQLPSTGKQNNQNEIVFVYHNGQWSQIPTAFAAWKGDISMVSADEGWAVYDSPSNSDVDTFYHYQHGTWTNVADAPVAFRSLSMASATDGWAVASGGSEFYHFDGSKWQQAPVTLPDPNVTHGELSTAYAPKPGELWFASASDDSTLPGDQRHFHGSLFHVVQQRWQVETLPVDQVAIVQIVSDADGGTWAVGVTENPSKSYIFYKNRDTWIVYGQG